VLVAGLSHLAVTYFAPAKYQVDGALIYLITAAYVAQAYYLMYTNYLFHFHKTIMLLFITGFSGLLGVFLNIWLIPSYGMVGAAIATLVSFASLFVLTKGAVSYLFRRAN
jgi:O-antigen/teichoic acid export membrane protein